MSIDPTSFEQQLAYKLTQAPVPAYDPAHWDQLEDQLQHLNQHLQAQHTAQHTAPQAGAATSAGTNAAGGWLAGPFAKLGFVAALAGLTATNAWLISRAPATTAAAPAAAATALPAPVVVSPLKVALLPAAPRQEAPVASAPVQAPLRRPMVMVAPTAAPPAPLIGFVAPDPIAAIAPLTTDPGLAAAPSTTGSELARPTATPRETMRPDSSATPARPATSEVVASFERLSHEMANIITPNGDGRNDFFELPFAPGTYRLTIYDGHGRIVLDRTAYDNSWDAAGLPAGPYLYTVRPDAAPQWRLGGTVMVQR